MTNATTLAQRFAESCRAHAGAVLVTHLSGDDTLIHVTYGEALARAGAWAGVLRERGIGPGDRVAFVTPKSANQLYLFYACWWVGAIAVPVSEGLGDAEMSFVFADAEPRLLVSDGSMEATARRNGGTIPLVTFDALPLSGAKAPPLAASEADAVACLIYTSGSTGRPKGVTLTHRNLLVNAEAAIAAIHFTARDSLMSLLPYWHSYALVVEVVVIMLMGARLIVPQDKRDFMRNVGRYRPTVMLLVPRIAVALQSGILKRVEDATPFRRRLFARAMHNASRLFTDGPGMRGGLLRHAMHRLLYDPLVFRKVRAGFGGQMRFFFCGGAPLDLEHQVFFKRLGIPIFQGYGLTEASPVISANSAAEHRLGSSGRLLRWLSPECGGDCTFKDESGAVGRHLHGELLVKGDCVMKGYWRHRDESAKTLADGWLHTGDMGYLDEDGFLFLEGRQGNLIVLVGGEKLHPEHVEDAIKGSGLIAEAMVLGERCKNVYAAVNVNAEATRGLAGEELLRRVREEVRERTAHLAPAQRIKDVLVLPDFCVDDGTLTVTLKIRRHAIWSVHGERLRAFLVANGEETAAKAGPSRPA